MLNSKAYTETYYIINLFEKKLKEKIPIEIMKNIEDRMDKTYEFHADENNIENMQLLEDTEKILSVLYTDYLATDEERKVILNKEKILSSKNKKELSPIQVNQVFENNIENLKPDGSNENKQMVEVKKEKWYLRIVNFIKEIIK
jgi:hypothetical protein